MPFIESNHEFAQRHGGQSIYDDGWILFPDGAKMEPGGNGIRYEPPYDAYDLAKAKLRYQEAWLARAVEHFHQTKQSLINFARQREQEGFPPPGPAELAQLEEAQRTVRKYQQKVNEAKAALEATPRAQMNVKRQQREAEARVKGQAFVEHVLNYKV